MTTGCHTILGATGFIGRHLVARLRAEAAEVFAPPRDSPEIYERSLGTVYYCIGLTADWRSRPLETVQAHVTRLAELLERARFDKLVYLSSTRVYKRAASGREDEALAIVPTDPDDLFEMTKLVGEALCLRDPRAWVARLSNVTGDDIESENFLPSLIREALSGAIRLRTALESSKDYVVVDDAVSAIMAMPRLGKSRVFNVASGITTTHGEIVEALRTSTGCRVTVEPDAVTMRFPQISIARASAELGFSPQPMTAALASLIEVFRASRRGRE